MKRLVILSALAAAAAAAQPPPPPPPPANHPAVVQPPPGEMRRPLDQYLRGLREWRPDEYQRLSALRETDPEALQRELRERRDRLRERGPQPELPELRRLGEVLAELPAEDRPAAVDQCVRILQARRQRPGPGGAQARVAAGEERIADLARAYREADTQGRKDLRAELRQQLDEVFDLREAQRRSHIEEAEKRLAALQEALALRRKNRREIVRRRLNELTRDPPPDA